MAILFPVARVDGSICGSVGLSEEGKQRPFYRWLSSKQRPATSLSIGGSLKRRTTATVAAEANLKVKLRDLCACGLIKTHDPCRFVPSSSPICRLMKRVTDVDCVRVIRWFDEDASHEFFRQRTARSAYRLGHEIEATAGHEWRQCCVVMQVTSGDSDGCCRVETVLCLVVSCCFVVVESAVL
ncbi:hypothetical protein HID58_069634 [Brassica napus]|uniref:Uncharacterized protein n=1 Tax=Brassica napus TaxID=3708 RepID=A0ABQ7YWF4_BRANA|nr:hypothetical protein HID58_069634 [Brassica napus]